MVEGGSPSTRHLTDLRCGFIPKLIQSESSSLRDFTVSYFHSEIEIVSIPTVHKTGTHVNKFKQHNKRPIKARKYILSSIFQ